MTTFYFGTLVILTVRDDQGFGSDRPPHTLRDRTLEQSLKLALLTPHQMNPAAPASITVNASKSESE